MTTMIDEQLYDQLVQEFFGYNTEATPEFPKFEEIVYCHWWEDSYEGNIDMLWVRDGQLYQYEGGHCSCNGYYEDAGTFTPDRIFTCKTTPEAQLMGYRAKNEPEYAALMNELKTKLAKN